MRAVLEQHEVTLRTRLDLLRGALDAWQEQRRLAMTSDSAAAAWRGARLGLVPSAFIVANSSSSWSAARGGAASPRAQRLDWFRSPSSWS